jgi:ribosome-associated protein
MEIFKIKESESFIELNKLLQIASFVSSGGEAKIRIKLGEVLVNGEVETRIRKKLYSGDIIVLREMNCKIQ